MMNKRNQQWRFVNSGYLSGKENMRIDESFALSLQQGEILPTLRVYGWKPWAVSLGYNQRDEEISFKKCSERNIDIVRRPTGGRAILHANELTYSVVLYSEGRSIHEMYAEISNALALGLQYLGAEINFQKHQPDFSSLYKSQSSIPCFSSSARFEILHGEKKLVGSAQRRYSSTNLPEVVLQHGSILIGEEHQLLAELLSVEDDSILAKIKNDITEHTTTLNSILQRKIGFEETASAIKLGFEQSFNIDFTKILANEFVSEESK